MYKPVGLVKTTDVVTKSSRVKFYGFGHVLHVHNRISKRWSHDIRRHSFQSLLILQSKIRSFTITMVNPET